MVAAAGARETREHAFGRSRGGFTRKRFSVSEMPEASRSSSSSRPARQGLRVSERIRARCHYVDSSFGLLRARRKRPRGRAAEQRDELAPSFNDLVGERE